MPSNRMVNSVVMGARRTSIGIRHSGAARSAEPGILCNNVEIPGSRRRAPRNDLRSLLRLAGVLDGLEGLELDVVEFAVDLVDLPDVHVLPEVPGFRIDPDLAALA